MYQFLYYFALYLFYSCCGWLMEIICCSIVNKKFTDRGFLIGPYCPIYGWASISMIFFLGKYHNDPITLFCMAVIICSVLEYFTSYIMENLFHARWWDYSHRKFNLNGRICLENSLLFGALGFLLIKYINPNVEYLLNMIPQNYFVILTSILLVLHLIDIVLSFSIITKLKLTIDNVRTDATNEITDKVKYILKHRSIWSRRLIKAFPNIKIPDLKRKLK